MLSYLFENSCHVTKLPAVQSYYIETTEIPDVDKDQNGFNDFFAIVSKIAIIMPSLIGLYKSLHFLMYYNFTK